MHILVYHAIAALPLKYSRDYRSAIIPFHFSFIDDPGRTFIFLCEHASTIPAMEMSIPDRVRELVYFPAS
jgi:hypothetical protein